MCWWVLIKCHSTSDSQIKRAPWCTRADFIWSNSSSTWSRSQNQGNRCWNSRRKWVVHVKIFCNVYLLKHCGIYQIPLSVCNTCFRAVVIKKTVTETYHSLNNKLFLRRCEYWTQSTLKVVYLLEQIFAG